MNSILKRIIVISGICIIFLVVLNFGLTTWLEDSTVLPKLPIISKANTLTITSNGCCFLVEDITVSLVEAISGKQTVLAKVDKLMENDIFIYEIPNIKKNSLTVTVSFTGFYGDRSEFNNQVLQVDDIQQLRQDGLLLYFQEHDDMYLNVIFGDKHTSYKMGDKSNLWTITDVPNVIYP